MAGRDGVFLWGARSQARIVATLLAREGRRPTHLFDATLGAPAFPTEARFANDRAGLRAALDACGAFVVCIGGEHGAQRAALSRALVERFGMEPLGVVSPAAIVDETVRLGRGVQIMPGACISIAAEIGDYAIVNTGATVDHECLIGSGVHVMGSAALAGRVRVADHATIGTNATVLPDLAIGTEAYLGAGAVAIRDLAPGVVAAGVPARQIGTRTSAIDLAVLDAVSP